MLIDHKLADVSPLREKIRATYRLDEETCLQQLIDVAELDPAGKQAVFDEAYELTDKVRELSIGKTGIQSLLNEYSLSSEEGVLLMCLAEALLRIPDSDTADKLIQDKLQAGDWQSHVDSDNSLFVNASAWGLVLTGSLVDTVKAEASLPRLLGKLSEPVIRQAMKVAMRLMGNQFVLGRDIDEAMKRGREQEKRGFTYSFDMLGEGARTMRDADGYFEAYKTAINAIGKANAQKSLEDSAGISVKLSAIHPRYEYAQRDRVMAELTPKLLELVLLAKSYNIGFTVDAEESYRLDLSLDVIEAIFRNPELDGWEGFGFAIQAYQRRALAVTDWAIDLCHQVGRKMMLRLVKGAYWDTEIKLAQVEGQSDYPVFTRKASTDVSYQACAKRLLDNREYVYPQFATHNAYSVCAVMSLAGDLEGYEFQLLHGMGEELYNSLLKTHDVKARIYAPVGKHEDLLAYLVRRLLENGANTSFVNNIIDTETDIADLIANPINKVKALDSIANPNIPAPRKLYGDARLNSDGSDISDTDRLIQIDDNIRQWLSCLSSIEADDSQLLSHNPSNLSQHLGTVRRTQDFEIVLNQAQDSFDVWSKFEQQHRSDYLLRFANLLQKNQDELFAICMYEAGKTLNDAVAEVREAIDFCRYYAAQALQIDADNSGKEPTSQLGPRGIVLCISPWNFPLAIFLGQVTAALSVGNTVIAKPASQTVLIAQRALELLLEAGIEQDALQLLFASGSQTSQFILPDPRVKTVMFTGSTQTGNRIAQTLAEREGGSIPLIAETGGQNCMMVDSSALLEQVVDDVIVSGFQSAGQRCSALRVLFVQEDIADDLIEMVVGAMRELVIAEPTKLSTDVGPVIDQAALAALQAHADRMQSLQESGDAALLYQCELDEDCQHGTFFAPRLYEISHISALPEEVFGPCVHVIRYKSKEFDRTIDQINSTGFGLTAGIHSRIELQCRRFAERVEAGNIYINRNTIGAIVGVQPFGGHGLSGTGPKAGGPFYLKRLLTTKSDTLSELNELKPSEDIRSASVEELDTLLNLLQVDAARSHDLTNLTELDGPTGERNEISYQARGVLLAINDGCGAELQNQMSSALSAGNSLVEVLVNDTKTLTTESESIALSQPTLIAALERSDFNGVLLSQNSPLRSDIEKALSRRAGALVPLITEHETELLYPRLVLEKVISTDTTASGGNAALLAGET